jgi:Arc/MetJ-type ribon-helix-helix transcriptional regulator
MFSHLLLPPHLEQFVREQIARGHFPSETEVICAALTLLEEHSPPVEIPGTRRSQGNDQTPFRKPLEPVADRLPGGEQARPTRRHSPRGILADLRSDLSLDELEHARNTMWSGFSHGAF